MTSPAQLKYLNAMGIPVWVSRDLVIEKELSLESSIEDISTSTTGTSEHSSQVSQQTSSVNSNNPLSARGLLDSLEDDSSNRPSRNQSVEPKQINTEVIDQAVSAAKVNDDSSAVVPDNETSNLNDTQNLLYESSSHYIFSCGAKNPTWMVIGHSPESFSGIGQEPFAGEAGNLLDNMLRAVGIQNPRSQAYLLNVIDKFHSSDTNASNLTDTKQQLKQKLLQVITEIKPQIVLFVGQKSAQNLLDCNDPLIIMRSKVHKIDGTDISSVVTYYPSYLLQKPLDKRKAWNDLKLAMSLLVEDEAQN